MNKEFTTETSHINAHVHSTEVDYSTGNSYLRDDGGNKFQSHSGFLHFCRMSSEILYNRK